MAKVIKHSTCKNLIIDAVRIGNEHIDQANNQSIKLRQELDNAIKVSLQLKKENDGYKKQKIGGSEDTSSLQSLIEYTVIKEAKSSMSSDELKEFDKMLKDFGY